MRKATLLIAVLLCFGLATAFAGPVEVEPEYEAEASATWGAQLDEMTTGFTNSAESTIMFTFIEEQTAEYGEGTTYGYIEVADFSVEFEAAGEQTVLANNAFSIYVGDITGKVFFGPAYLVVYSGASDDVDELNGPGAIGGDIITAEDTVGPDPNVAAEPTTSAGVALGYEVPDLVTLELGVESRYDWGDDSQNDNSARNAYVWSLNADITPVDGASVAIVSNMWHGLGGAVIDGDRVDPTPGSPNNPAAVGISGSYDFDVTEDMVFRPVLGFDMATEQDAEEDQEMRWEVGTGLNLLWPGLGVDESEEDFLNQEETEVTSGVAFEAVYGSHPADFAASGSAPAADQADVLLGLVAADEDLAVNTLAFQLGLYEDSGDDGFLPIVGAALLMNYNMVLANDEDALVAANAAYEDGWADFGVGVEFDADLGVVTPYVGVISEMFNVGGNDELSNGETLSTAFVNVGTDIDVIPNTTFTVDYASGDLLYDAVDEKGQTADASWGYYYGDTFGSEGDFSDSQAGELTFTTSISF